MLALLQRASRSLSPAYFALVMATGIVSLAAHLLGMPHVARALLWLNAAAWVLLWLLTALRLAWFPRELARDLVDHAHGPGFFTAVAATSVLGSQCVVMLGDDRLATLLWIGALVLWVGLTYTVFTAFTVKQNKPALEHGISGAWLLPVVATQSIAVLSGYLAAHAAPALRLELNFLALSMWLWGGMQYIWMISLIFYRYTFFPMSAADLSPPYWINMGAMAISTLAGSLLILNAPEAPLLASMLPFLEGFTVLYWATGTWWIPMLLALGVWRYGIRRFPLAYDPLYWGAVFPFGMYTAATLEMARALRLDFLGIVPRASLWIALGAWALAFIGLVRALRRGLAGSRA